jgi:hypothetical protein
VKLESHDEEDEDQILEDEEEYRDEDQEGEEEEGEEIEEDVEDEDMEEKDEDGEEVATGDIPEAGDNEGEGSEVEEPEVLDTGVEGEEHSGALLLVEPTVDSEPANPSVQEPPTATEQESMDEDVMMMDLGKFRICFSLVYCC